MTARIPLDPYRPWFRRRPGLTLASIAALFAAVTVVRVSTGADATTGITMLYVLPVSLAALAWGRGAGVAAATVALTLIGLWVLVNDVQLSFLGRASRGLPLMLVGFLLGDAADRLRRAEQERVASHAYELLRRQAVEVNDRLVQGMAAAKWTLESGSAEAGLLALDATLREGQTLVSELIRLSEGAEAGFDSVGSASTEKSTE